MYVGTVYSIDRITYSPLHPGVSMIDWEIRFFQEGIQAEI